MPELFKLELKPKRETEYDKRYPFMLHTGLRSYHVSYRESVKLASDIAQAQERYVAENERRDPQDASGHAKDVESARS